jgi:C-3',4' desaturase CrtD
VNRLDQTDRVVVIGAGIGGLLTAAVLARAGLDVTVLEANVYPGGCASTFFHQGYLFDAGATLVGGLYSGGPLDVVAQRLGVTWPARRADVAMVVHLPDGLPIVCPTERSAWESERRSAFGLGAESFWRWQERIAGVLWDLAVRLPPWPPTRPRDLVALARSGAPTLLAHSSVTPAVIAAAFRPVDRYLAGQSERLRRFVDAQLLIAAQATSKRANALYGAAALDLARRGVVHLEGGVGGLARTLEESVRLAGGRVLYRREASRIVTERGRPVAVETRRGEVHPAGVVVANLTPWNVASLFDDERPPALRQMPDLPPDGWGAFVLYVGVDEAVVPMGHPLHHQVVVAESLGEGNSLFLSISPDWDHGRAPVGRRAITISTHTDLRSWWDLFQNDRAAYEARKTRFTETLLAVAETVLPGLRSAAQLIIAGTPVSFQRFTRRASGWVGGFPQTGLFRNWAPSLGPGLWLVGDSVFPGQSTAAVALGALRVADDVLRSLGLPVVSQNALKCDQNTLEVR